MKIQLHPLKFNRMTFVKAAVCLVIILAVLITSAVCISFVTKSAAYDASLGIYGGWVDGLAERDGESIKNIEGGENTAEQYVAIFGGNFQGFDGVAVVTESGGGRVVVRAICSAKIKTSPNSGSLFPKLPPCRCSQ